MASAYEIANYLVYLMSDVCDDLTNMKINKLLYYAQGHSMKKYGRVMFDDRIEAWDHGPIVYDVYTHYKDYGDRPISEWNKEMLGAVSAEDQECLMDVARTYSRYTAAALRNMTHVPNGPWDKAYEPGNLRTEIPVQLIKDYFENHVDPIRPIELNLDSDSFVGYRDSDGYLVLPEDWDDEAL